MKKHERMTFDELKDLALRFRESLADLGVTVSPGGELDKLLIQVEDLPALRVRISDAPDSIDVRPMWRDVLAVRRFALKFVRLYRRPGFDVFAKHLTMLDQGKFTENQYCFGDQGNKMFELLIGLLAFEVGTNLALDDPLHSGKKKNQKSVDIQITFGGQRWGIECKVPTGGLESLVKLIDGGVEQIESVSEVEVGAIAISARNALVHDEFWPRSGDGEYQTYVAKEFAYQRMKMAGEIIENQLRTIRSPTVWKTKFNASKTQPVVLGFLQSACSVMDEGRRTVTDGALLMGLRLDDPPTRAPDLFNAMNLAMHDNSDEA